VNAFCKGNAYTVIGWASHFARLIDS
jgi:hypothetical protein